MEELYADTIVGINFNNGVVKLVLANQDLENVLDDKGENNGEIKLKSTKVISMPLPGFLYSASVIENLLNDEKMIQTIESYKKAGVLPEQSK